MPMNATTLSSALKPAIVSEMNTQFGAPGDPQYLDKMATAIAKAVAEKVVEHITANALVAVTITSQPVVVASVSGVTTGPGVSGPGTGTVTGTATGTIS